MKNSFLLITLLLTSSLVQAEYSRTYFDRLPVASAQSTNAQISYRVFNRGEQNPKLLLIMGLGGAGAAWGDAFIKALEFEGFEILVVDNRDTGDSTMFTEWGKPTLWWQLLKYELGFAVDAPYRLNDMALDSIAVLDAAGYQQVHVMGVSMGGMIAQVLAAQHPERVQTLTSIMSTTFAPHLPPPTSVAEGNLRSLAEGDAEASREEAMRNRGFHPNSMERHLMAVFGTGDRTEEVQTIKKPTLVIHGSEDPLIPPPHGVHTAEQITDAKFVLIEGMGHNLPEAFHPKIIGLLSEHINAYREL